MLTARICGALAYVETAALRCGRAVHQLFEVVALHHVGQLTRRHLVFQRQKSVQKHAQPGGAPGGCAPCVRTAKFSFSFLKRIKPRLCCFR